MLRPRASTRNRSVKNSLLIGLIASLVGLASPVLAEEQADVTWIDVRSWVEHQVDSIDGDTHIHYTDIVEEVSEAFPDKSSPIRLYCAVGGRSGKAEKALKDAGYTDVVNVGGIDDARKLRGLE